MVDARGQPQMPNWFTNQILLYAKNTTAGSTVYAAPTSGTGPVALLGVDGAYGRSGVSHQDPATHRNPAYAGLGPRIVSFGNDPVSTLMPRVTTLTGDYEEAFETGDSRFTQCHHPAWNVEGTEILCMRNESVEHEGNLQDQPYLRALYRFKWDGNRWGEPGRLFEPMSRTDLEETFGDVLPPVSVDGTSGYTYKYAEWCGSNAFVLLTLYGTEQGRTVLSSRVMMVRIDGPTPRYWDVTAAIEEANGVAPGQWQGIFGTCSGVRDDKEWSPCAG